MIRLECPNCKKTFKRPGRYDVGMDDQVKCICCGFTVSKWCFTFVHGAGARIDMNKYIKDE